MAQAISALRAKASGAYDDVGIVNSMGGAIIAAGDLNSIAYSRTPAQVRPSWRCTPAQRAMSRDVCLITHHMRRFAYWVTMEHRTRTCSRATRCSTVLSLCLDCACASATS